MVADGEGKVQTIAACDECCRLITAAGTSHQRKGRKVSPVAFARGGLFRDVLEYVLGVARPRVEGGDIAIKHAQLLGLRQAVLGC